jgi:hypothetical protein
LDYSVAPLGPTIDATAFPGTKSTKYWTASPRAKSSTSVWSVLFNNGYVSTYVGFHSTLEVRCVRGGAAPVLGNRYAISAGGGVVTDNWTKLQWQRAVVAGKKDWSSAKSYCSGLSLEGSGWRLPTVRELHGLVDKQKISPALDKTAFPNTPSTYFWSASPRAGAPTNAWFVNFYSGIVNDDNISFTYEVRCVRGS